MTFDLKSRKFIFAAGSVIVLFTGWIVAAVWPKLQPMFSTFTSALVMIVSAYLTSNAAHHFAEAYGNRGNDSPPTPDISQMMVKGNPRKEE